MTRFLLLAAKVAMGSFVLIIGMGLLAARVAHAQACNIASKVFQPDAGYTPIASGLAKAATPSCTVPDNQNGTPINNAFALAPPLLQADLCSLKCIVVLPAGSGSWGKWANNKNGKYNGDGSAAIGIDANDLTVKLSDKLNNNLIGLPGSHSIDQSNDTIERSLMYTLAHEMAHIKWRRDFPSNAYCPIDTFIGYSWKGHAGSKVRRWTYFGNEFGDFKGNNKFPSQVTNENDVYTIYTSGFVTALAATNPEEDFVESYAIGAIMALNQGTATITLKLPTIGKSVFVDDPNFRGNNNVLKNKIGCVSPLLQSAVTIRDREGGYGHKRGDGRKKKR